jgi:uncharacterized protein (TIGR02246 family)
MAEVESPTPALAPESVASIEGVVEQYRQAYEVGSAEALAALYSQDLDLVLVYQGQEHRGWTAVQTFLAGRLEGASSVRMSVKDVTIRELGEGAAVVTARRESSIGDGSVTVSENGMLTLALQNQQGRWMVVAEHFSYPTR